MVIVGGLLGGYLLGKCVSVVGGFIYDRTTGRKNERKWAEFMALYNRLKEDGKNETR